MNTTIHGHLSLKSLIFFISNSPWPYAVYKGLKYRKNNIVSLLTSTPSTPGIPTPGMPAGPGGPASPYNEKQIITNFIIEVREETLIYKCSENPP